jgi:predicted alpha/beta-hydrolase family hydrolase
VEDSIEIDGREALGVRPAGARWLYVLGHGAGAGMRHPFMADIAAALAERGVATLRWEMPYMAAGKKRPDPPGVCEAAARAACLAAARWAPALRRVAGGKSMGGRMTSQAEARASLGVEGLVFLGFPLHPAKQPGVSRAAHLAEVSVPMLFVQGTRDALAAPELLAPVVAGLGERARLVEIAGADHGFDVLARSGRKRADVLVEVASAVATWLGERPGPNAP